jgi:hypothetical protein
MNGGTESIRADMTSRFNGTYVLLGSLCGSVVAGLVAFGVALILTT